MEMFCPARTSSMVACGFETIPAIRLPLTCRACGFVRLLGDSTR